MFFVYSIVSVMNVRNIPNHIMIPIMPNCKRYRNDNTKSSMVSIPEIIMPGVIANFFIVSNTLRRE